MEMEMEKRSSIHVLAELSLVPTTGFIFIELSPDLSYPIQWPSASFYINGFYVDERVSEISAMAFFVLFFSGSLLSSLVVISSIISPVLAATLPPDEVTALKGVAEKVGPGKNVWDFSVDPCTGWSSTNKNEEDAIWCDCDNTTCHVVRIYRVRQDFEGTLPKLLDLPNLRVIDFSRNLLNGSIPPEWGSSSLTNISLMGNRLTGSIPKEIGNIITLQLLQVEGNQLSGALPPELGNLTSIDRMLLNSNNFTGELPASFAKLTTITDFRVSDNNLTGKIPDFIQNWTNLDTLFIQASGLDGPIPSVIGNLRKMVDLRIGYLNGNTLWPLPDLSNMSVLQTLVLTSCNLNGSLPLYLANMVTIEDLDLSFNHFTGEIPANYSSLTKATHMYFTGNALSGIIPDWVGNKGRNLDLSYNNFTFESSTLTCDEQNLNLFRSYSGDYNSGTTPCPRNSPCSKLWYDLHINCGGEQVVDGGITYEKDKDGAGSAMFRYNRNSHWAVSSTGNFLNNDIAADDYISSKKAADVQPNTSLYLTARLSPLSLTYYGYCLGNGNYTVVLHFAEIEFETGMLFSTLMRRVFHVYIQGNLVLKDFDIVVVAGGVGKGINVTFAAVVVSNNTLEIRFYWAGRGKTGIPFRQVSGPLISAISVTPEFKTPENSIITTGAVVGIAVAVIVVFSVLGIICWKYFLKPYRMERDLRSLDLQTGSFSLRQLKAATNDFDPANKIGEGGFGSVYKGLLSDGTVIAVKQLSSKSKQGNREFINEIGIISSLQHPHLVRLHGCCIEGNQLLLVYEYMENNCLARALFGPEEYKLELNWSTRHKICVGIARGLAYLHEESRLKIVHRDIKATNVLLDKDLNPKISDFGLAKLDDEDNTHISTRIAGTFGYMAPEYAMRGYLTDKADVYSFGIIALELVSGRSNTSFKTKENSFYLLDWALILKEKGRLIDLVDPALGSSFNKKQVMAMIKVALLCVNVSPAVRPSMSSVVSMLVGQARIHDVDIEPSISDSDMTIKFEIESIQEQTLMDSEVRSDAPWTGSSVSDLYSRNLYPVTSLDKTD